MPNHVTTVCAVTGPVTSVQRFRDTHIGRDDQHGRSVDTFDFNTIVPMPALLRNSEASGNADLVLLAFRGHLADNAFFGSTVDEQIRCLTHNEAETREQLIDWLKTHRPGCLDNCDHTLRCFDKTGYTSWYEWSIRFWGTKWGAYDVEVRITTPGRFVFKFETAWSFPRPVFQKLTELYPDLVFSVVSFDEGWNFACSGSFGGANDFARVETSDDLYRAVYGQSPPSDSEGDNEEEPSAEETIH
jgi:hypothetical protein